MTDNGEAGTCNDTGKCAGGKGIDSTLACLANIYGEQVTLEDDTQVRRVKIPTEDYPGVLDRFNVSAVMLEGQYVITAAPKPQEVENGQV